MDGLRKIGKALTLLVLISATNAQALTVRFNSLVGFNEKQLNKILEAKKFIEATVNSPEFKDKVLNFTYDGKKQFNWNEGMSNEQIYELFMSGKETLNGIEDQEMDFEVELYKPKWYQSKKTIGYTMPSTTRIWCNVNFFNKFTPQDVAGNLVHEWIHKIGFGHSVKMNSTRPYTVPYAIGYFMDQFPLNPLAAQ